MNQKPLKESPQVEIFHRINRIKKKVAKGIAFNTPGTINPEHIKNAQAIVDNGEENYKNEIHTALESLDACWKSFSDISEDSAIEENLVQINKYSNHIMDLASVYGYELMAHFGKSLRDFSSKINPLDPVHQTIVQAHINVMWVAYNENIKEQDGKKAEELKLVLKQAIQKYSAPD